MIPVLLPGAQRGERSKLPAFLTATTWVEFQAHAGRARTPFTGWWPASADMHPGPGRGQAVYEGQNPYRGLRTFDVEHAPFFFGREALTGWLLDALRPKAALGGAMATAFWRSSAPRAAASRRWRGPGCWPL